MSTPSVTRFSTLERFIKSKTDLRLRRSGLDYLLNELDSLVTLITNEATAAAQSKERTTILLEDFEQAADTALRRGSVSLENLLATIETLPVVDIVHLADQVNDRADEIRNDS